MRIRTPSGGFGDRLLSQEHTAEEFSIFDFRFGIEDEVLNPNRKSPIENHKLAQLDVPVRLAEELRPAFDPHLV